MEQKAAGGGKTPTTPHPPTDSGPKRLHLGLIFNHFGGFLCSFGVPFEGEAAGRAASPRCRPPHSAAPVLGGPGVPLLCLVPACTYPLYRAGGLSPQTHLYSVLFGSFWILTVLFFIHFLSLNSAFLWGFLLFFFSGCFIYLLLIFNPSVIFYPPYYFSPYFLPPIISPLNVVRYQYCNLFCQHVNTV